LARARPFDELLKKYPNRAAEFRSTVEAGSSSASGLRFLPVVARGDWVAVLDQNGDLVTFLPADGFF
jgi:hypothetical protein